MKKWFPKLSVYWASVSVLLIFGGMLLSASLGQGKFRYSGAYVMTAGFISLVLYLISAALYILFSGDKSLKKTLITLYLVVSTMLIIGGLIMAFLSHPNGMSIFIIGLISMAFFWVAVIFYMIFYAKGSEKNID